MDNIYILIIIFCYVSTYAKLLSKGLLIKLLIVGLIGLFNVSVIYSLQKEKIKKLYKEIKEDKNEN